jgi:outer membrane protein TolC
MQDLLAATKELYQAGRRTAADVAGLEYHVAEAKGLVPR